MRERDLILLVIGLAVVVFAELCCISLPDTLQARSFALGLLAGPLATMLATGLGGGR